MFNFTKKEMDNMSEKEINQIVKNFGDYLKMFEESLICNANPNKFIRSFNADFNLNFEVLGHGYTSFVIGNNEIAIKIYADGVNKENPELCNDMIMSELSHLGFIPHYYGGIKDKFIIMNAIKHKYPYYRDISIQDINTIFLQMLQVHLSGVCVNDLHWENIAKTQDNQYIFIDVGAFSKEGYVLTDGFVDFVSKEKATSVPTPEITKKLKYAYELWKDVYEPLISKVDKGIINEQDVCIEALKSVPQQYIDMELEAKEQVKRIPNYEEFLQLIG